MQTILYILTLSDISYHHKVMIEISKSLFRYTNLNYIFNPIIKRLSVIVTVLMS